MSDLNYLEKLLDGYEVEWIALKEVVSFRRGSFPQPYGNSEWYDGEGSMPFVQVVDVLDGGFALKEKTKQRISKLAQPKSVFVEEGTVIVTLQGTIGRVAITQYDCFVDRTLAIFTNYIKGINKKYFAYQLKNKFDIEKVNARGSTLKTITKEEFSKFQIPIPCPDNPKKSLEIQAEIVRILDTFTELTTELTTELNARKKQYNYYRDQLLSFEEGEVEWKSFGEVAKVQRGASPRPIAKYITEDENGVPWVKIGDTSTGSKYVNKTAQRITPDGAKKSRILKKGDFILSNSMSFGRPYILDINGAIHDGWASISDFSEHLNSDYLYHFLSSKNVQNYWVSKINSGSVSNLNADLIKTLPIPIPPIAEQERIVAILDKFDALTNSITEGLPREIELRQKQYEYYRDLLLSFPKPEADAAVST